MQPDPVERVGQRAPWAAVCVVVEGQIVVLVVGVVAETLYAPETHGDRV